MGQPDGGWYDETPPHVIGTSPADKSTGVKARKVYINFDEFIKIENASENVIVSPPQLEAPDIKSQGKRIVVSLRDSLKPNTTYTIDFSDAITDNNEGNPLGNYTYSFSTGDAIDSMEVSGYVLNAEDLEPVEGILVGLYNNLSDTAFTKLPMLRVGRTDSKGHFIIRGVAPGQYHIYALRDADANYMYSQKSEELAFSKDIIVPSSKPDIRQDTLWRDSLHIQSVTRVSYTHFLPDDIALRAFTATLTDRYLIKKERNQPESFTLFFSYGSKDLPTLKGLNFNEQNALLVESNEKRDTITYWLRDTTLVNQDTLRLQLSYEATDSTGALQLQTDTLDLIAKESYAKRMKNQAKEKEDWLKKQEKAKKKGERYDSIMPQKPLTINWKEVNTLDPDRNITFESPTPLAQIDTSKIHLYSKIDSLWYRARFQLRPVDNKPRTYEVRAEWRPGIEYSLEIDSTALTDIYGKTSDKKKIGFMVGATDSYSSLFLTIEGMKSQHLIAQLVDEKGSVVKKVYTDNGTAEFFYITPGIYYVNIIVDSNNNGRWDTGDYYLDQQPEAVYYYPESIECKAKWDVTRSWNPTSTPITRQKPSKLVKQKSDKKRTIRQRNAERAAKLGITYNP